LVFEANVKALCDFGNKKKSTKGLLVQQFFSSCVFNGVLIALTTSGTLKSAGWLLS